jgi:hypothetical protein
MHATAEKDLQSRGRGGVKLTTVLTGLGVVGLAGFGIAAMGGLATGNLEVTGSLDEIVADMLAAAHQGTGASAPGSSPGMLAQWLVGFPIGSAALLVLALRFAPYIGHMLTSWSDEAREWAQLGRALLAKRNGLSTDTDTDDEEGASP